ncbi:gamma-glutamylcyclotransferase family protein [Thalassotalea sp. Y01]|uniref:gamma-glutamylcyclotransferase family protein n=1 Tax=Thalassotalea sp. Y01 TaxID=2729613 RepID=UPI00145DB5CE|nr:gamma-glutamylcyclotransferase family protein [Thalassotalea sp. Y01]NMP14940.1 gamma-glutamylcyclotransferase [Thalassotalea sp. Y01]
MSKHLFVYGSLCPEQSNEHILTAIGGRYEKAKVKGHLYQQDRGAWLGYPGIVLDKEAEPVSGYLFISDNLPSSWTLLDDFEGEGYQRVETDVLTEQGRIVKAFVYQLKFEQ